MATELVSDQEEFSDSARDTTRVSFNVERATQRAATKTDNDSLRRSLQSCPVESNKEMLEGLLHHYRNNMSKSRIIEALLFVLRQLLAPVHVSLDTACRAWGFLTFDDAFVYLTVSLIVKLEKMNSRTIFFIHNMVYELMLHQSTQQGKLELLFCSVIE